VRRARAIVAIGVIAAAALFASTALGAWQYRGEVADGHRTAFQLIVRHRGGKPSNFIYAATGRLHLRCDGGGHRRKALELDFGFSLYHGRFDVRGTGSSSGGGGPVHRERERIEGKVGRRHAAGTVRLLTRVGTHHCDSGHLRWHADFVPRDAG
jgi:hypothetical protein